MKLKPKIGFGVFARQSTENEIIFRKGNMIAKYNGEFLHNKEYDKRYENIFPDGPYSIYFNHTHTIDSGSYKLLYLI